MRVLSPEDYVLFKLLSARDRDLEDAVAASRGRGRTSKPVPAVRREAQPPVNRTPEMWALLPTAAAWEKALPFVRPELRSRVA